MNNVVFITALDPGNRLSYKEPCLNSWKHWCNKNNVTLFTLCDLNKASEGVSAHWIRYWAADILKEEGIEFEKLAIVDLDTLIHPDADNIFNEFDEGIAVVQDYGGPGWTLKSFEHMKPLLPEFSLEWDRYCNSGVIALDKNSLFILELVKAFYLKHLNQVDGVNINEDDKGFDQTPLNHFIKSSNVKTTWLKHRFNLSLLQHKKIRSADQLPPLKAIYHFAGLCTEQRSKFMSALWEELLTS